MGLEDLRNIGRTNASACGFEAKDVRTSSTGVLSLNVWDVRRGALTSFRWDCHKQTASLISIHNHLQ